MKLFKTKKFQQVVLIFLVALLTLTTILLFLPLGTFERSKKSKEPRFKGPRSLPYAKGPTSSPPSLKITTSTLKSLEFMTSSVPFSNQK